VSQKFNRQFDCSKMMLPEHRSSLDQQVVREHGSAGEVHSLSLDQQELEQLQRSLEHALVERQPLRVTVLAEDGRRDYTGIPLRIDQASGVIYLSTGFARPQPIEADRVLSLEPADHR